MSFISYAQNFEDVMLWRALKDVENGFYIDVGANHPIEDSVTKAFYDNGWTGINVEPEKEWFDLLEAERPEDKNLNLAVSCKVKSIEFFVSNIRGWSTTDKNNLDNLKEKELLAEKRVVPAKSLDELCKLHKVKEIHFLKVDVEGSEKDVLESFSFDAVRPWIIIVEATKPSTQIDVSSEWEYILLKNKYSFAYFDGLNKYYVAQEHSELMDALTIPPNVFDEFIVASQKDAIEEQNKAIVCANEAEARANEAEAKANEAEAKISEAEAKANEAEAKANEAEARANEAEAKANEAEARANEAEARSNEVEVKAHEAEARAHETAAKTHEAAAKVHEAKAYEAEVKANEAEAKANEAEAKANEAQAKEHDAEAKAYEAEAKAHEAQAKAHEAEAKAHEAEAKVSDALVQTSQVAQQASDAATHASEALAQVIQATNSASIAEERAYQAEIKLHNIVCSSSWKITGPYRFTGRFIKTMLSDTSSKEKLNSIEKSLIYRVKKNAFLRKNAQKLLFKYPKLHRMYLDRVKSNLTVPVNVQADVQTQQSNTAVDDNRRVLNVMERKIYNDIKGSLHKGNK